MAPISIPMCPEWIPLRRGLGLAESTPGVPPIVPHSGCLGPPVRWVTRPGRPRQCSARGSAHPPYRLTYIRRNPHWAGRAGRLQATTQDAVDRCAVLGDVSRYRGKTADLGAYEFDDLAIAETGSSADGGRESGSAEPGAQVIHEVINSLRLDRFEG